MLTQKHRCNLCLWLLVRVAYWRKLLKSVENVEKRGLGWWKNCFGDFPSHVKVSVFYLLYSLYSFKDAVTSSKTAE